MVVALERGEIRAVTYPADPQPRRYLLPRSAAAVYVWMGLFLCITASLLCDLESLRERLLYKTSRFGCVGAKRRLKEVVGQDPTSDIFVAGAQRLDQYWQLQAMRCARGQCPYKKHQEPLQCIIRRPV